ncbi:MAG: hypothetical protein GKR93_06640 [Gammaproteobacteria bacterium]|nr:hypothetical protein [Gammaproteobacteria bacterium]
MLNQPQKLSLLKFKISGLFLFLWANTLFAEEWVPVYEEPRHRLVFENDETYILNVKLEPDYVSLYHQHKADILYVTIGGTTVWAEPLGGKRRQATVDKGDLRFSSDNHPLPHIHRVGNIGQTPFHVIGVARKSAVTKGGTPIEGDTSGMEMAMEKDHASVYRIKLAPGEKSGLHSHNLPYARVFMSDGEIKDQKGKSSVVSAADYLWLEKEGMHSYENAGESELEIIEVQWR